MTRHEHETWINTLMSKIRIYSQLERLKQLSAKPSATVAPDFWRVGSGTL